MTLSQIKGMLRMHKMHYKAYKSVGDTKNAKAARRHMLEMYLKLRATR